MTEFAKHFERKTRDSGEPFVTLKDDAPEWLQDAVQDAHQGTLPNDWIYAECLAAVEAFDNEELGEDGDGVHEHADGRVDTYTRDLYQWAADMCLTDTWASAESEAEDMGPTGTTLNRIASIQYCAIRHIAEIMRNVCLEAMKEAAE